MDPRHSPTLVTDLLAPDRVIARLSVNSKRRALQKLAQRVSSVVGQPEAPIAAALRARERLGSTGIGTGVAIPHARLPDLHDLFGLFARLEHPIDFAAIDDQPVDLLFLILAPSSPSADQLGALSLVLRLLRDEDLCVSSVKRPIRGRSSPCWSTPIRTAGMQSRASPSINSSRIRGITRASCGPS